MVTLETGRSSSSGYLSHAQSTPVGIDGRNSYNVSRSSSQNMMRRSGKMISVRVQMLDDTVIIFHIQAKALGRVLFEQVCKQLNLLESDYFGLEYRDGNVKYWLDLEKQLQRQVGFSLVDPFARLCVKFYTPDPAQLEEEFTRFLFCLQVKRDLAEGELICNENTTSLIISYFIQAECGDYIAEDYPDQSYLATHKFVATQDQELERRIMENHKRHSGQSPAEADLNLLETVRRCEMYGMRMHPAKDLEGVPLNLAVAHMGITIFQNNTKINTFSWAKIRKISFKRKRFLIKLHPEGYGYYKDVVEFIFEGRNECKSFWKKCVEHHGFFRCTAVKPIPRQKTRVLSRGSSFRYSGRTQKQVVEFARENYVSRQSFQRSQSFRHPNSVNSSTVNVGSISAHPLIPLGDKAIAGSGASLSCGSMTLSGSLSPTIPQDIGQAVSLEGGNATRGNQPTQPSNSVCNDELSDIPSDAVDGKVECAIQVDVANNEVVETPRISDDQMVLHIDTNQDIFAYTNGHLRNNNAQINNSKFIINKVDEDLIKLQTNASLKTSVAIDYYNTYDNRRKRPTDQGYYLAKELMVTERTYRKDLEIVSFWLRDEMNKNRDDFQFADIFSRMHSIIDPLYDAHCILLRDLEMRLTTWDVQRVGDIMEPFLRDTSIYENYIRNHLTVINDLNYQFQANEKFECFYSEFEVLKVCYLPLMTFLLKPLRRILQYADIFDRLLAYCNQDHQDYQDILNARSHVSAYVQTLPETLRHSENLVLLYELSRDVLGIENLVSSSREFVRQGCLAKFSQRKGYQQRMFFLFSDVLVYAGRTGHLFRIHGRLPLYNASIQERPDTPQQYSFSIFGGNRVITVAASSQDEKDKWLEDLTLTTQKCKVNIEDDESFLSSENGPNYFSLKSCNSVEDIAEKPEDVARALAVATQRNNTTVHVCWHRNTSFSFDDHLRAAESQLSGFLLRKFKNSNGWQKLWVVFANLCLFFYKTHQDDCPLASLPLLGYVITFPTVEDNIQKEFVFKLQFKNHIYFFRAESEHTFKRWMDVISKATLRQVSPSLCNGNGIQCDNIMPDFESNEN